VDELEELKATEGAGSTRHRVLEETLMGHSRFIYPHLDKISGRDELKKECV
jgi:hypothetical protein